ncbi:hypothetical protein K2173_002672 [Erythroxylum novogranatense]|uniref:Uncharacterized protein n=1 Tax=Erythroxylum novogranatense TaxID=1862640 RepID=A0AAV8SX55_9ROSI|nr:hypothetical protein K2173_002672 [Erythroxylum novogranatense]
MLKACAKLLRLNRDSRKDAIKKKELEGASVSLDLCRSSKDFSVRIIHAGGRVERYQHALPASQLMEKYPGMCIARPDVFKDPDGSLLKPNEDLLPGLKYLMIPSSTARKLKHKHKEKDEKLKGPADDMLDVNITWNDNKDLSDESFCSAKDFYASKDRWSRCSVKKRTRIFRGSGWEPSLTSVEELSPEPC